MMTNELKAAAVTEKISHSFVNFPHIRPLLKKLETLLHREWHGEEAENVVLFGDSGVGKSTILEKFHNMYPPTVHPEFTEIPVLYVRVPTGGTATALASAMLLALQSPFWDRGKLTQLTYQILCLLKACKVKMILLDEVNHLVDKGGVKTHHATADWIKELTDDVKIPIVMAGIPRATRLLVTNEQLRGRFREVISIKPFSVENDDAEREFCRVLRTFSKMIGDLPKVDFTAGELPRLMLFATGGYLRDIRRLLVRVVELGFDQPSPKITMPILASAFRQVIYADSPDTRNPFCDDFEKTPLTRLNEPFAPREEN